MSDKTFTRGKLWALTGPALVAGVAYLDPGNVATNITAGTQHGYQLLWVILVANIIAWLVQYLAAKLGLATNQSLSRAMGERFKSPVARTLYWAQAQLVAIATDLAEVIGGAIALNLMFGIELFTGCLITAAISTGLLYYQAASKAKTFEIIIIGLILLTTAGFTASMLVAGNIQPAVDPIEVPQGPGALMLTMGIFGATIMPHAVYVHSALSSDRLGVFGKKSLLKVIRIDVTIAMAIAGAVNVALLVLGAKLGPNLLSSDVIKSAFLSLNGFGIAFGLALFSSSLASTSVGTYAGDVIMDGLLLKKPLPIFVRQAITLVPALLVLGTFHSPTGILVISQIFISFGIPFALFPLLRLTSDAKIMGKFVNSIQTRITGYTAVIALSALNVYSIWLALS